MGDESFEPVTLYKGKYVTDYGAAYGERDRTSECTLELKEIAESHHGDAEEGGSYRYILYREKDGPLLLQKKVYAIKRMDHKFQYKLFRVDESDIDLETVEPVELSDEVLEPVEPLELIRGGTDAPQDVDPETWIEWALQCLEDGNPQQAREMLQGADPIQERTIESESEDSDEISISKVEGQVDEQATNLEQTVQLLRSVCQVMEGSDPPSSPVGHLKNPESKDSFPYYNPSLPPFIPEYYLKANFFFDRLRSLIPEYPPLEFCKGIALKKAGKLDLAHEQFDRVIELCPGHYHGYLYRGMILGEKQKYKQAREDFKSVVEHAPEHVDGWYTWGLMNETLGDYEDAITQYTRALEIEPKYLVALEDRSSCYLEVGDVEQAIEDLKRLTDMKPHDYSYCRQLAECLRNQGRYEEAVDEYERAIDLKNGRPEDYYGRGEAFREMERYGRAVMDYSRAIEEDPEFAEAYVGRFLARSAIKAGKTYQLEHVLRSRSPTKDLEKALELQPELRSLLEEDSVDPNDSDEQTSTNDKQTPEQKGVSSTTEFSDIHSSPGMTTYEPQENPTSAQRYMVFPDADQTSEPQRYYAFTPSLIFFGTLIAWGCFSFDVASMLPSIPSNLVPLGILFCIGVICYSVPSLYALKAWRDPFDRQWYWPIVFAIPGAMIVSAQPVMIGLSPIALLISSWLYGRFRRWETRGLTTMFHRG
ncbi:MAG: tetratricopeptide repeat protein [bacterium]